MDAREALRALSNTVPGHGVLVVESTKGRCNVGADGDGFEIVNALASGIDAFGRNINCSFKDVIDACFEIRSIGYKDFVKRYKDNDSNNVPVLCKGVKVGNYDMDAEKTAVDKCKVLTTEVKTLNSVIDGLRSEIENKNMIISGLKEAAEVKRKAVDKQIKALQKEIKAEQHRNYDYLAIQGLTPDKLRALAEEIENG